MTVMFDNRGIGHKLAILITAFGLWTALVLLFAAQMALAGSASWRQAVSFGGSFWALWLIFLPSVIWLSFRFPMERRKLFLNVSVHVLACLIIVVVNRAGVRALNKIESWSSRPQLPGSPNIPRTRMLGAPGAFGALLGLRAALDVLVYGSLVGFCWGVRSFQIAQEKERRAADLEAKLTQAQLQALRMQIQPHFLFNTLNSISALVYTNPRAADEMLGNLGELFRRSLTSMEEQEVPLEQELSFIEAYLGIEQKRFGDRLELRTEIPIDLMQAMVPSLLFQPLVENAIRHGIEPRRGPGCITLEARQEDQQLRLVVRDNGKGLSTVGASSRQGIGLSNTRARLQGLYGAEFQLRCENVAPEGCQVEIRIPFHLQPGSIAIARKEPAA